MTDISTGGVWRRQQGAGAAPAPNPVKGDPLGAVASPIGERDRIGKADPLPPEDLLGPEWDHPAARRYPDIPHVGPVEESPPASAPARPLLRSVPTPPALSPIDPPPVSTPATWASFDPVESATDDLVSELSARLVARAGDDLEAAWSIDDPVARVDELLADLDLDGYGDIIRERVEAEAWGEMLAAAEELAERQREEHDDDDPW